MSEARKITLQFRRSAANAQRPARRGRPPKFGRPSQVVALTLPEEVLDALRARHRDLGWAIVQLVEPVLGGEEQRRRPKGPGALAELVHLPGRRALIVVQPHVFTRVRGVSTVPLADGRAFLALDHAGGLADLEVAILDKLETAPARTPERRELTQVLVLIRAWRRDVRLVFSTKSIIVVEERRLTRSGARRTAPSKRPAAGSLPFRRTASPATRYPG